MDEKWVEENEEYPERKTESNQCKSLAALTLAYCEANLKSYS